MAGTENPTTEFVDNTQDGLGHRFDLADLTAIAKIVEIASTRGAFRASEMSQVGTVYDKLVTFLKAAADAQAQAQEEAANSEKDD